MTEVIVKVGREDSKLKFRDGIRLKRAITTRELLAMADNKSTVVIEDIASQKEVKDIEEVGNVVKGIVLGERVRKEYITLLNKKNIVKADSLDGVKHEVIRITGLKEGNYKSKEEKDLDIEDFGFELEDSYIVEDTVNTNSRVIENVIEVGDSVVKEGLTDSKVQEELINLKSEKLMLESKLIEYEKLNSNIKRQYDILVSRVESIENEKKNVSNKLEEYKGVIDKQSLAIRKLKNFVDNATGEINNYEKEKEIANKIRKQLEIDKDELKKANIALEYEKEELADSVRESDYTIERLQAKVLEGEEKVNRLENEIRLLSVASSDNEELVKFKMLENEMLYDTEFSNLRDYIEDLRASTYNIVEVQNRVTSLDRDNNNLRKINLGISEELNRLREAVKGKDAEIRELQYQRDKEFESTLKSTLEFKDFVSTYSNKVFTVFGNASNGITTTAISVARGFADRGKRVAYVDLDLVSAKGDIFLRKSPKVDFHVDGIHEGNRTSMKILFDKGIDFYESNIEKVCIPVHGIDYFSGMHGIQVNEKDILRVNFKSLVELLGNRYDIVVMDVGKMGIRGVNNDMIRNLIHSSTKSLAVIDNDRLSIKNMCALLQSERVDRSKLDWVINMSHKKELHEKAKHFIAGSEHFIVPFEIKLHATRTDFRSYTHTNAVLAEILNRLEK